MLPTHVSTSPLPLSHLNLTICPSHNSCVGVVLREGSCATASGDDSLASKKSLTAVSQSPALFAANVSAMSVHGAALQSFAIGIVDDDVTV
jgi:hypothetical protein